MAAQRERKLPPYVDQKALSHVQKSGGTQLFSRRWGTGQKVEYIRFRDLYHAHVSDLGGEDFISEAQRQLIRRCALMSVECERAENLMIKGEPYSAERYLTITNTLRRTLVSLGLERKAVEIVPDISDYYAHSTGGGDG